MSENQTSTFDNFSHILNPIGQGNAPVVHSEKQKQFCEYLNIYIFNNA